MFLSDIPTRCDGRRAVPICIATTSSFEDSSMAARTRPLTGDLRWELGDYSILRTVDSGKFGIVYWAEHKPTGRQAALKLIPLEGAESDEKVAAERHGAMLQQQFSRAHRNMV